MRFEAHDLSAWYGTAQALFGAGFEVDDHEIIALLGRNGAGKTTALRSCAGVICRARGSVRLDGQDLGAQAAYQRFRRGVAWVPDDRRIFANLSVEENIRLGIRAPRREVTGRVGEIFEAFPMLADLRRRYGKELSGGQQQVVAIGRGLASRPRVLLLDEPTEGLAPVIMDNLSEQISQLPARFGVSVVMAESNLAFALDISSRAIVFENGRVVAQQPASELRDSPETLRRFLGLGVNDDRPAASAGHDQEGGEPNGGKRQ
ncbi:MAG: ABC transporter ATP-binding protein [Actinomycetota bacterium]|nr:ABC transporter ATP-binding protein [Actinomycetota bacterium]